jgi:hypothetical protein
MQSFAGRTRPANAVALIEHVATACYELGYLMPEVAPALAYVIWAQWHENDAPRVFRALGHRIKREMLAERRILPQTVLTDEAWTAMTAEGRNIGPIQAYNRTVRKAADLWLNEYKLRNPRWIFAFRRSQEGRLDASTA